MNLLCNAIYETFRTGNTDLLQQKLETQYAGVMEKFYDQGCGYTVVGVYQNSWIHSAKVCAFYSMKTISQLK